MQGMLATWADFDPAGEADFNEWYNTEHLLERAMVPGFYNARRYETDLSQFPRLVEADAACQKIDAFARAAPEATKPR